MRTEFEKQIAAALAELEAAARCPDGFPQASNWERANHLAPRVVAAIDAAIQGAYREEAPRENALAALLGGLQ